MKISKLEKCQSQLQSTTFKDYKDKVRVDLGLKCLVVSIHQNSWDGPLPTFIENIPITYIFGAPKGCLPFTR